MTRILSGLGNRGALPNTAAAELEASNELVHCVVFESQPPVPPGVSVLSPSGVKDARLPPIRLGGVAGLLRDGERTATVKSAW